MCFTWILASKNISCKIILGVLHEDWMIFFLNANSCNCFLSTDSHHWTQIHYLFRLQRSPSHSHLYWRSANCGKTYSRSERWSPVQELGERTLVVRAHGLWQECIPSVTYFGLWLHLQALICLIDKKTGEKGQKRPRFVKQDQVCIARLRTAGTICLETFKEFPQMGRFTLRDEGKN